MAEAKRKRTKAVKPKVETPVEVPPEATEPKIEPVKEELAPDLKAAVVSKDSPQVRAKMVRWAFSARDWPNEEHQGTVRDFLVEHEIPIIDKGK